MSYLSDWILIGEPSSLLLLVDMNWKSTVGGTQIDHGCWQRKSNQNLEKQIYESTDSITIDPFDLRSIKGSYIANKIKSALS